MTKHAKEFHPGTDIAVIKGAEVGTGGGEIIVENERVRIKSISLAPGERTALHTHVLDYVLVQIEAGEVCHEPHPQSQGVIRERKITRRRPGVTAFITKGGTEVAVNTGDKLIHEICIELKE